MKWIGLVIVLLAVAAQADDLMDKRWRTGLSIAALACAGKVSVPFEAVANLDEPVVVGLSPKLTGAVRSAETPSRALSQAIGVYRSSLSLIAGLPALEAVDQEARALLEGERDDLQVSHSTWRQVVPLLTATAIRLEPELSQLNRLQQALVALYERVVLGTAVVARVVSETAPAQSKDLVWRRPLLVLPELG